MTKQKKWFRAVAILFGLLLGYASYDIARRTTFPGSRPQLKERIEENFFNGEGDSVTTDSAAAIQMIPDSSTRP